MQQSSRGAKKEGVKPLKLLLEGTPAARICLQGMLSGWEAETDSLVTNGKCFGFGLKETVKCFSLESFPWKSQGDNTKRKTFQC